MYFFLKDEFLVDFMKMAGINSTYSEEMARTTVKPVKEPLLSFVNSIKPHFRDPENVDQGLIRLKIMELLYDLASTDKNLLLQLLQLKKQVVADRACLVKLHIA